MDTLISYDIWIDTGQLVGVNFTKRQVIDYVNNLSYVMLSHRMISEEKYGNIPVFTKAEQWKSL